MIAGEQHPTWVLILCAFLALLIARLVLMVIAITQCVYARHSRNS